MKKAGWPTRMSILLAFLVMLCVACADEHGGRQEAVTAGGPAPAAPRTGEKAGSVHIPFRLIDDHIVIAASVNGTPELDMILDTGMGSPGVIVLDPEMGKRLNMKYVARISLGGGGTEKESRYARVAAGARLSVAGLEFTGQQVLVLEDSSVFAGSYADGIIGATLFDRIVDIDYDRCALSFSTGLPAEPSELGHPFDLRFTDGIPVITASVEMAEGQAIPVELLVDTGVNDPLLLFGFSDERLHPSGETVEGRERVLSEGLTGRMLGTICRIPRLKLGPFELSDVVTALPDEATMGGARRLGHQGMLGNEVLQRFRVVFDYPSGRMFLQPNKQHARGFEYNTAGLVMSGGKQCYKVEDVLAGSPAEKQGVRAGDRIVAINGRPIHQLGGQEISEIFTRRDTTIEVTIERQSERSRKMLPLRRLI